MNQLDEIENQIFLKENTKSNLIKKLYQLKRKTGFNSRILSLSADWVKNLNQLNISDAQYTDFEDSYKDVINDFEHLYNEANNLISIFIALSDQQANKVTKILAIYSVYFLPITFIAGVYGMNFGVMPELHTRYGYFITLGVIGIDSYFYIYLL